jgi:hypothetical protein
MQALSIATSRQPILSAWREELFKAINPSFRIQLRLTADQPPASVVPTETARKILNSR